MQIHDQEKQLNREGEQAVWRELLHLCLKHLDDGGCENIASLIYEQHDARVEEESKQELYNVS